MLRFFAGTGIGPPLSCGIRSVGKEITSHFPERREKERIIHFRHSHVIIVNT